MIIPILSCNSGQFKGKRLLYGKNCGQDRIVV